MIEQDYMQIPQMRSRVNIYEAWNYFISKGKVAHDTIRSIIVKSWGRCKSLGVDPHQRIVKRVLTPAQFSQKLEANRLLLEFSIPLMKDLHQFVKGSGFIIALSDAEGYLLEIIGDSVVSIDAARGNFVKRADWSEASAGTNGIGTVLIENMPLQIYGNEHYCRCSHKWTCSGAPIHDPYGNIIGAIDMTGRCERVHPHTLGMVVATANAIEKQLSLNRTLQSYQIADQYKAVVMDSIYDSLIVVDINGVITYLNRSASKLFQINPGQYIGCPIERLFASEKDQLVNLTRSDEEVTDCEVEIALHNDLKIQCLVTSRNIGILGNKAGRVLAINEQRRLCRVAQHLAGATARMSFENLLGNSPAFRNAIDIARQAARGTSNVLILGESGTGKDIMAQAIHNNSIQAGGPFVVVNCAALPRDLIASELFGYSEGAFTGARKGGNPGKFELADGGTIFLDEIGDMPLALQTMLLRVIETKTVMRVGGNRFIPINTRIVAATNKNLYEEVAHSLFRGDLFYRLNVVTIQIPSLRERVEDIPLLLDYFNNKMAKQFGKPLLRIPYTILEILTQYHWPGNVRQLQNLVERAYNLGQDTMILPSEFNKKSIETKEKTSSFRELERSLLESMLSQNKNNVAVVAQTLGVARSTIYRMMRRYGINK